MMNDEKTRTLAVDNTTAMLINMLQEKIDNPPLEPDVERYVGTHLESIAFTYYEWQRTVFGLRALIGTRLTNAALKTPEGETE